MIYTIAQHLIDTENAVNVPGLIEDDDFPKAALALSAVAVHFTIKIDLYQCAHYSPRYIAPLSFGQKDMLHLNLTTRQRRRI